jgi:hypothetical protein
MALGIKKERVRPLRRCKQVNQRDDRGVAGLG